MMGTLFCWIFATVVAISGCVSLSHGVQGLPSDTSIEADPFFRSIYPPHYVSHKLGSSEEINVDGRLDEAAWQAVPFTDSPFVDIAQLLYPNTSIPTEYQTQVKLRWDDEYLYVGAVLGELLLYGNVTGHNENLTQHKAPYWDNDFEVFIDVSGTTHFYKEFEMNLLNATYDVLWRVPDTGFHSPGVPCNQSMPGYWCTNSTFSSQTWTMAPRLQTQTFYDKDVNTYHVPFDAVSAQKWWSLEIAFPIHPVDGIAGGLLDADAIHDFSGYFPQPFPTAISAPLPQKNKNAFTHYDRAAIFTPNGTRYWSVNFARAEHPLQMVHGINTNNFGPDFVEMCKEVQAKYPTLLGVDQWSCYWEWVWADMKGSQYMHNPEMWGVIQFGDDSKSTPACNNIEWPVRYLLSQIYQAEIAMFMKTGKYSDRVLDLIPYCSSENSCSPTDLKNAGGLFSSTYDITITVQPDETSCLQYTPRAPTGGPCFQASIEMQHPNGATTVKGTIHEDRYMIVISDNPSECL